MQPLVTCIVKELKKKFVYVINDSRDIVRNYELIDNYRIKN